MALGGQTADEAGSHEARGARDRDGHALAGHGQDERRGAARAVEGEAGENARRLEENWYEKESLAYPVQNQRRRQASDKV